MAAAIVLVSVLTACGNPPGTSQSGEPGGSDRNDFGVTTDSTDAGTAQDDPDRSKPLGDDVSLTDDEDSSSFDTLARLVSRIRATDGDHTAVCMADRGFPQLTEAELLRSDYSPIASYHPLRIDPLNLGPYTDDQARTFGYVGTYYQFGESQPGNVISNDQAWDDVYDECERIFDQRHAGTSAQKIQAITSSFTDLENAVSSAFREAIDEPLLPVMVARTQCMKSEYYPTLNIEEAIFGDDDDRYFASLGIEPGRYINDAPRPERDLAGGEVIVVPPPPQIVYEPSASEIQYALAWVDCGEKIGFIEALRELQKEPRERILEQYELTILGLMEQIEELDLP